MQNLDHPQLLPGGRGVVIALGGKRQQVQQPYFIDGIQWSQLGDVLVAAEDDDSDSFGGAIVLDFEGIIFVVGG